MCVTDTSSLLTGDREELMRREQKLSPELKRKVDSVKAQREQGASMKATLAVSVGVCRMSRES